VSQADVAYACAVGLVDELALGGVRQACVSPGSRSTPLALALSRDPRIAVHVHLDERSGAFFALGIAKALRRPVAVLTTSGTAAAELLPAVVEASQSRIPLLLLTADRPPRLRGTGANQTIDQEELFGGYARAYFEPSVPAVLEHPQEWRRAARVALNACGGLTPGPVQIDCPFDEPLVPEGADIPTGEPVGPLDRPDTNPAPTERDVEAVADRISGRRGVVVIGGSTWAPPGSTVFLAERLGWPVIAEPTSNVRRPGQALGAGQALLGAAAWLDAHRPEIVLQIGATPTTRSTQAFVASSERLIVVDAHHLEPDPQGRADLRVHADPERLSETLGGSTLGSAPPDWLDDWRLADTTARRALDDVLDRSERPTELQIARDVAAAVPSPGTLFVGNSMPVRDLDLAMAPRDGLDIHANRGASGIDGLVSTVFGISAAGPRPTGPAPTVALIGDLSLLHDAGALLWNARRGAHLTLVVINNGGGQIFASLAQRTLPELTPLFVTPHDVDLGELCVAAGAHHARVDDTWALGPATPRSRASDRERGG
jgi:2-succinyl-5-enolpyruvyl-6-hydroxy-3-cyclohexene-1-carboxylate synthase